MVDSQDTRPAAGQAPDRIRAGDREACICSVFTAQVRDIFRFGSHAPKVLEDPKYKRMTMQQYLHEQGYSTRSVAERCRRKMKVSGSFLFFFFGGDQKMMNVGLDRRKVRAS